MLSFSLPSDVLIVFLLIIGLFGLLIGSFLNVVIIRLPKILFNAWQMEYFIFQNSQNSEDSEDSEDSQNNPNILSSETATTFNLCFPASHCLNCQQTVAWYDNIPVLSFLCLKGRCRHCQQKISPRYPLIELLTAVLSLWVAMQFGLSPSTLAGLVLTWFLITITFIDIDHKLIPDNLTLPGLWAGLLFNVFEIFQDPSSAILGAVSGYLILWSVYWVFKWVTGKEGMGYGDFKLLAMLGAWLGWQALPLIVLIASFSGTIVAIGLIVFKKKDRNFAIPFGPFLALGGWLAMLWGPTITHFYFQIFNL
jgi:leader peptidase (prepilin peptidase)/N-methyltransferase